MSFALRSSLLVAALLLVVAAAFGVVSGRFSAAPAEARGQWTYRTANVQVGSTTYTVDVAMSAADARRVTGPIRIQVAAAGRVSMSSQDAGFANRGYTVSGTRATGRTVTFTVTIPARGNVSAEIGVSSVTGGALSGPATTNVPFVIVAAR